MRFFDRTEEIASLKEIQELSKNNAQFTVVTGRRRIGKTYLVWKAYEDHPIIYFFVARKADEYSAVLGGLRAYSQTVFVHLA